MLTRRYRSYSDGLITVLEEIKVKNVIISKQPRSSANYEKLIRIVQEKRINVILVKKGDQINIEENLKINILWPDTKNFILDNPLNNNSIVCKICYKNISLLFTGDIEEKAEKEIVKQYKNKKVLKSDILKVAHHGSKTSTTDEFLSAVSPKVALIGVRRKQYIWTSKPQYNRKIK